ncbi:MAG TPA: STAS domain-containing protein [Phycisphaerae bacterium]|nr:STAS domain-containing protein [Phycisphaerae bacterium]HNU44347.1 STAS domain-containing protein [Phycisphaerae bacterium]
MKVGRQQIGTVEVFSPVGALVDNDATQFTQTLFQVLSAPNPRVVVSLQDVPYMDSIALEGLVKATEELADRATKLKLAQVSPTCREILELTNLAPRFRFFNDVQDAVRSFL